MKNPYLLHIFSPAVNVSPFDVNMAYEAEYDSVIPYNNVMPDDIHTLTQDTIFSRSPTGIKRTGIFIGGREFGLAIDMLEKAKAAMVPPFEVSVFVDPSGAITTAAAMIASIQTCLKKKTGDSLQGKNIYIIGGTGPVGVCAGIIAETYGAKIFLFSSRGKQAAQDFADKSNARFNVNLQGADGSNEESVTANLQDADIVINSAKAGIQVISKAQLEKLPALLVAADANAVPPLGIEGVDTGDMGKAIAATPQQAAGIGALAIGNIKYKVHCHMFNMMKNADKPLYLDHHEAFKIAQQYVEE